MNTSKGMLFCPLLMLLCFTGCGKKPPQKEEYFIVERFDDNTFDRTSWEIAQPAPEVAVVELKNNALQITAPPSKTSRPQIRNLAKFSLSGDFVIKTDFELIAPLPDPESEYINLELIIYGEDGSAHLSRTNHKGSGNGFVCYFAPKTEALKSIWNHHKNETMTGTLMVKRIGTTIDYYYVSADSEEKLASTEFGHGPISGLAVALSVAAPTNAPIKVSIDNVEARSLPK